MGAVGYFVKLSKHHATLAVHKRTNGRANGNSPRPAEQHPRRRRIKRPSCAPARRPRETNNSNRSFNDLLMKACLPAWFCMAEEGEKKEMKRKTKISKQGRPSKPRSKRACSGIIGSDNRLQPMQSLLGVLHCLNTREALVKRIGKEVLLVYRRLGCMEWERKAGTRGEGVREGRYPMLPCCDAEVCVYHVYSFSCSADSWPYFSSHCLPGTRPQRCDCNMRSRLDDAGILMLCLLLSCYLQQRIEHTTTLYRLCEATHCIGAPDILVFSL